MKWYFACSSESVYFFPLIKAAVNSALVNTTLKPCFIYDGEPNELTQWLESHKVEVIFHKLSFEACIKKHFNVNDRHIPLGAYLRCDIPIIEKEDEVVLYTDCDVLFLKDIKETNIQKPEFFSCSSQFNKNDFVDFNTGVMFMNVKQLAKSHSKFVKYIEKNINKFSVFDQSAYQSFYGRKNTPLDVKYNHKPYWGIDDDAFILHFHGPKPLDFSTDKALKEFRLSYYVLYKKNIEGYQYYLKLFKTYLPEIEYSESIELLNKGSYPINKTSNRPIRVRAANFIRKKYNFIKSLLKSNFKIT